MGYVHAALLALVAATAPRAATPGAADFQKAQGRPGQGGFSRSDSARPEVAALAQPGRSRLREIDLSDADACVREIAELASFGSILNNVDGFHPNAVGMDPYPDDVVLLDYVARYSRLTQCKDEHVRSLAARARTLWEDSWRLNCADQDFGLTWNSELSLASAALGSMLGYVVAKDIGPALRDRKIDREYRDANGVYHQDVVVSDEPCALEIAADEFLPRAIDALKASQDKRAHATQQIAVARGLVQDRMAKLWATELWPLLTRQPVPKEDQLVTIGALSQVSTDPELLSFPFGMTGFRNTSSAALHRVAARLTATDEFGDSTVWYAYLPTFAANAVCVILPSGVFTELHLYAAGEIHSTLSVHCLEGQHDLTSDQTYPKATRNGVDFTPDDRKRKRDETIARLTRLLSPASELLHRLPSIYGAPRDPVAAQAELVKSLLSHPQFKIDVEMPIKPIAVAFENVDARTGTVNAAITFSTPAGQVSYTVPGRIEEEVERGSVLALYTHDIFLEVARKQAADASTRDRGGDKAPGAPGRRRGAVDATGLPTRREGAGSANPLRPHAPIDIDSWKRREVWLLTSLRDMESLKGNDPLGRWIDPPQPLCKPGARRMRVRSEHAAKAELLVFLSPSGELSLQCMFERRKTLPFTKLVADESGSTVPR